MKKCIWMFLLGLLVLVCLIGCSRKNDVSEERTFIVGFDANFPPYGYKVGDTYVGFDLDLAREVATRNNWKLVLRPIDWSSKDEELNSGAIDCIWNGFAIEGREQLYTWSEPYVNNCQVVLVLKQSPIQKLSDLKDKVIAIQNATPVQKALGDNGSHSALGKTFKKLVLAPDYDEAIMQLEADGIHAVILDESIAIDKAKSGKFRILEENIFSGKNGIGFRKGDTELRDQVQKTLKEMVADGTAGKISARYFDGRDVLIIGR